jgi:sulfatase modifying factor 1
MKTTTATAGLLIAASVFSSLASASVTIDWVTVGNAGNAADPLTGFGVVAYEYKIGKYEVTNAQYGAFLNAAAQTDSYGLYNASMSSFGISRSGSSGNYNYSVTTALANRPVVLVSWFDAARFANWMMNGQGSGSTETGAYTLNGATSGIILANAGAQFYIPTEDEWYKAAYYNAVIQSYSLYPNGQNAITTAEANYNSYASPEVDCIRDVGSYSNDPSSYGTFDQGGNLWEWSDAIAGVSRWMRGGGWSGNEVNLASSSSRNKVAPSLEDTIVGFRLASVLEPTIGTPIVPEPSAMVLTIFAGGIILIHRKR